MVVVQTAAHPFSFQRWKFPLIDYELICFSVRTVQTLVGFNKLLLSVGFWVVRTQTVTFTRIIKVYKLGYYFYNFRNSYIEFFFQKLDILDNVRKNHNLYTLIMIERKCNVLYSFFIPSLITFGVLKTRIFKTLMLKIIKSDITTKFGWIK